MEDWEKERVVFDCINQDYHSEIARGGSLDSKSSFLTATLSIYYGIIIQAAPAIATLNIPAGNGFDILLLSIYSINFLLINACLFKAVSVLRLRMYIRKEHTINHAIDVLSLDRSDTLINLIDQYTTFYDENRQINDKKAGDLSSAYRLLKFLIISMVPLFVLLFLNYNSVK